MAIIKNVEYYESTYDNLPNGYFFGFRGGLHCGVINVEKDPYGRKYYSIDIFYRGENQAIDCSENWIPIIHEPLSGCRQKSIIKTPNKQQSAIVSKCLDVYNSREYCKILLYGAPGTGKTFMRYAIGLEYKTVHYYPNYNPNWTLCPFSDIYNRVAPTLEKPLIISIDEVDLVIDKIMKKQDETETTAKSNSWQDTSRFYVQDIANKKEWCEFMDNFDAGIYPYVYLVMTTNRDREYFDNLDPALFREGRVNITAEFK